MSCESLITKELAKEHWTMWLEAEAKASQGIAYSIGGRSLTRADLAHIKERQSYWLTQYQRACANPNGTATGPTIRSVRPYG